MSRYVIYGAGGIGGTVGANLFMHDRDVVLITRGKHREEIASNGLRYMTPTSSHTLKIPVVGHPNEIDFRPDDVVLLTMKLQDSADALRTLARLVPSSTPIVCVQNGVEGERMAFRMFPNVYGCLVVCQVEYIEPGLVISRPTPQAGIFDLGRYPQGTDEWTRTISADLSGSNLTSRERNDVMSWKRTKMMHNLTNGEKAVVSRPLNGADSPLSPILFAEARAVYQAAGLDLVSNEEFAKQTKRTIGEIPGRPRAGSSTWQSMVRGVGSVETDYINGEIVLLGRLYGVPTPANELVQQLSNESAARNAEPGSAIAMDDFMSVLKDVTPIS